MQLRLPTQDKTIELTSAQNIADAFETLHAGDPIILEDAPASYMQTLSQGPDKFVVEYKLGDIGAHFTTGTQAITKVQAIQLFQQYLAGDTAYQTVVNQPYKIYDYAAVPDQDKHESVMARWWRQVIHAQFLVTDVTAWGRWFSYKAGEFQYKGSVGRVFSIISWSVDVLWCIGMIILFSWYGVQDLSPKSESPWIALVVVPFLFIFVMHGCRAQGYVRWMIKNRHAKRK